MQELPEFQILDICLEKLVQMKIGNDLSSWSTTFCSNFGGFGLNHDFLFAGFFASKKEDKPN